ncbi:DUF3093 family protein [Microbacterium aureliae]
MQNASGEDSAPRYRERLSPSLRVLAAAAVAAPMAALVLAPLDRALALTAGAAVGVALVAAMVLLSPVIEVSQGVLRAGRARIDVGLLGAPRVLQGDAARAARGVGLDPRSFHVIRGGIEPVLVVPITDPDDPAPSWVLSSRTPDRLAAAVRRAQAAEVTRRIPGR